ncbi:MAG: tRNA-dihydrouridine synthase family protein [Fretibacterium sp.]|nr:tRNA-dihydrouridine synthase family protein [Fretibacterium sp.]
MSGTDSAPGPILIGGLTLSNPLCLAPLAGVTAAPLRAFFSHLGAGLTHTEMVSCAGLVRGNARTADMLRVLPCEAPLILQLFAPDAGMTARGAEAALELNRRRGERPFAGLGINMACPMPKVTRRGAGAALLKAPAEAFLIVRALKKFALPVWVKMRRLDRLDETLQFIEGLLSAGADNVCLHGRTAAQRYEGLADRSFAEAASARFPGFISASGDVRAVGDVEAYLAMGCAPVMLARGALANPWFLPEALHKLGFEVPAGRLNPGLKERFEALCRLGDGAKAVVGERQAVVLLKRLMGGILRGMEGASELRRRAGCAVALDELLGVFSLAYGTNRDAPPTAG